MLILVYNIIREMYNLSQVENLLTFLHLEVK